MKPSALASVFRRSASDKGGPHEGTRARYLKRGMTHDMADLLVTLAKILDMPREERHTTPAGRSLWIKYMAGCAMVDADFEAFARNKAFEEFWSELKRLAALVTEPGAPV
ncbi:MAG TPA: hypothetical protein VKV22_04135 [Rhodanobacteraceae bacterium]|nr:hypothetical protein [Rhodanobacteraceae bacterium]